MIVQSESDIKFVLSSRLGLDGKTLKPFAIWFWSKTREKCVCRSAKFSLVTLLADVAVFLFELAVIVNRRINNNCLSEMILSEIIAAHFSILNDAADAVKSKLWTIDFSASRLESRVANAHTSLRSGHRSWVRCCSSGRSNVLQHDKKFSSSSASCCKLIRYLTNKLLSRTYCT